MYKTSNNYDEVLEHLNAQVYKKDKNHLSKPESYWDAVFSPRNLRGTLVGIAMTSLT